MSPWGVLTPRGRWLLLLGFALTLFALYRGQRDLVSLGLLLLLVPLVAVMLVRRAELPLSVSRTITPARTEAGATAHVGLLLDKDRDLAGGLMLFEEAVPANLGTSPRFLLHHTAGHARRELGYDVAARLRGRYAVGPLRVETRDALGLVRVQRAHRRTDELVVTPVVHPLPPLRGLSGPADTGEAAPDRLGAAGDDDVLVREYRAGDDRRRVHWRSTARQGELMVRREEQTWDPLVTLLVDDRASAHAGAGPDASLEWACSAAASIGADLLQRGWTLQAITASGETLPPLPRQPEVARTRLLDLLTDVDLAGVATFETASAAQAHLTRPHILVAVLGRCTAAEARRVASLRRVRARALALVIDEASFAGRPDPRVAEATRDLLLQAGWTARCVEAGTSVPDAWASLGGAA